MSRTRVKLAAIVLASGAAAVIASSALASPDDEAAPQAFPGANEFVSGLDLECFNTQGPALNINVQLTHLNRVLVGLGLPPHVATIRELQQTCVPVLKNNVAPSNAALQFIRHIDLACYRIETGAIHPVTVNLKHLNPVLANFPNHNVTLVQAVQLCVPVIKNNVAPPAEPFRLLQLLDLECYRVDAAPHPTFTLNLRQLNPQLGNIPIHNMTLSAPTAAAPRQLCVPVQKNQQQIPPEILNIVQFVDLEKFPATPPVVLPAVNVVLRHVNPLFTTLPQVPVVLQQATSLMVPVAKNGLNPPPP